MAIYWADLHNHNNIGYGKGSIERSYAIARSSLDVFAFTPHGWWSDLPKNDSKITDYHVEGFSRVQKEWGKILEFAKEMEIPGRFVTIPSYEWHSNTWGDYCILISSDDPHLIRPQSLTELKQACRMMQAIMIPHHCAYPNGKRGTAWNLIDTELSPVAEIFSEHGNSLEGITPLGMYKHSMGGSQTSQTIMSQLQKGLIIGFSAGTDNHFGHPGSFAEGLTALVLSELNKEQVFQALRARHTYAVTGERIEIQLLGESGHTMGDILPKDIIPGLDLDIQCHDELDQVELVLDGIGVDHKHPRSQQPSSRQTDSTKTWMLRIEIGWSGMEDSSVAGWTLDVSLLHAKVLAHHAYFSSGAKTVDLMDSVETTNDESIHIVAHTSRTNSVPVQTVLLELEGSLDAVIGFQATCSTQDREYTRQGSFLGKDLCEDDRYVYMDDSYAVPKIKFHRLLSKNSLRHRFSWDAADLKALFQDNPCQNPYRSLFFKIVQKNGHHAWTSPMFFQP
jgi:hypothetical protein